MRYEKDTGEPRVLFCWGLVFAIATIVVAEVAKTFGIRALGAEQRQPIAWGGFMSGGWIYERPW
jgi:hypothetical protein